MMIDFHLCPPKRGSRIHASRFLLLCGLLVPFFMQASARGEETQPGASPQGKEDLVPIFDGKSLAGWRVIDTFDFKNHGPVQVHDGVITFGRGRPATGISYRGELPRSNYELQFRAKRIEGSDFFCGLTFPVAQEYCTLILGGWGGQVVGLSNIDGFSAVENDTTQIVEFEQDRWYHVRLRVTDEQIKIDLDDKKIVEVTTAGRKFSIWWEQEPVTPLGLVTWHTKGALKDLQLRKLPPR